MRTFKDFSKEIDEMSCSYKKSWFVRMIFRLEYWMRWWRNEPMRFKWVEKYEGQPVGEPIEVIHLALHDMMEHEACGQLTGKVLLNGLRANAIERVKFEWLEELRGKTTIQPRWVEA